MSEAQLEVISQNHKTIERLRLRIQSFESVVAQFQELMANSDGVTGLHINGDIATWEELQESWLSNLSDLESMC